MEDDKSSKDKQDQQDDYVSSLRHAREAASIVNAIEEIVGTRVRKITLIACFDGTMHPGEIAFY
jgi:hypothetical protein